MQPQIELFARDLGGELTQRRIGYLIFRIEPGSWRHLRGKISLEVARAVAGAGARS